MDPRVVIAGGSGLIGRALAAELAGAGFDVVVLSRAPAGGARLPAGVRTARWDGRTPDGWAAEVDGAAAVVNLAGENVAAGRWTAARRARLVASRLEPTHALVAAVALARRKPAALIQASAVGYYGPRGDSALDEGAAPGRGFLPELTLAWEGASAPVENHGVRRVLARTGIVLARGGGALPRLLRPFRLGLGGPVGSGRQWFPWIHAADEGGALRFLIERGDLAGAFNLAAPEPVTNAAFARELAAALRRPARLRVPAAALHLLFGELGDVLLWSQRVVPARLAAAGYRFRFPALPAALADLVGPPAEGR